MFRRFRKHRAGAPSEADAGQAQQDAPPADPPTTVSAIFEEAIDSFMATLSPAERGEFTRYGDAQSMMSSIKSTAEAHPVNSSRMTAACRKFQVFVDHISPYFDVVEIFVQVKPEYMALIWGSLRMIFKVIIRYFLSCVFFRVFRRLTGKQFSTNYISYLEKMAEMFADIAAQLPAYEQFVTLFQAKAASRNTSYPRLAKALALVYLDIIRFCHSAYMLFANKDNSMIFLC